MLSSTQHIEQPGGWLAGCLVAPPCPGPGPCTPLLLLTGPGLFHWAAMSAIRVDAKVVMLGKESVGKTSLVERYVHHRFLVGPYQNVSVSCSTSLSMVSMPASVCFPPVPACSFDFNEIHCFYLEPHGGSCEQSQVTIICIRKALMYPVTFKGTILLKFISVWCKLPWCTLVRVYMIYIYKKVGKCGVAGLNSKTSVFNHPALVSMHTLQLMTSKTFLNAHGCLVKLLQSSTIPVMFKL